MPLPVVVHRYLPQCKTVNQPPGFADFLKGTAYLYQQTLVGKHSPAFELVVDFSYHPMGVFIIPLAEQIKQYNHHIVRKDVQVMECFNQNRPVIRNIVASFQNSANLVVEGSEPSEQNEYDPTPIITYVVCHEPYDNFDSNEFVLDSSAQSYMKSILNFTPELYEIADDILEQIGLKDQEYVVVHLRMGDQQSAQQNANVQQLSKVESYIQQVLIPQWGNRILVISDSYYTKKYLCNKYDLRGTDIQPVHMGEAKRFLNRSEAASPTDIGNTLIEFILMSRCKSIFLYSVYGWNSGFSKLCGHIYQIPYVVIEQQQI